MTVVIQLTQGQETVISDEDADLAEFKWHADFHASYAGGGKYIATRNISIGRKQRIARLHRVILSRVLGRELTRCELVDHVNGNPLDNRRENLRLSTRSQNMANQSRQTRTESGYKGVVIRGEKYVAQITVNRRVKYLGSFPTAELAHEAYKQAARELYGEFARFE